MIKNFSGKQLKLRLRVSTTEEVHLVQLFQRKGKIIAGSNNRVVLNIDPTAHAEILAIREAARFLGTHDLEWLCPLYFM